MAIMLVGMKGPRLTFGWTRTWCWAFCFVWSGCAADPPATPVAGCPGANCAGVAGLGAGTGGTPPPATPGPAPVAGSNVAMPWVTAGQESEPSGPADASVLDDGSAPQVDSSAPLPNLDPPSGVGVVGQHGPLRVHRNRLVNCEGTPVQLRGMSLFWTQWTDFYVPGNVDVMVDQWQATVVRAALGVENDGGYLQNPNANVAKVRAVVDRAIERGVYVIIDWHDHHAQNHVAQATAFFEEMVNAYGNQPHVIFEVYNEPVDVEWPVVKNYAERMIQTIRSAGSNNLIIVGTPTWSQDVDVAAEDPITPDDNVAYTLHFYANTHKQALRDKAQDALEQGIALFVTEWGTCSADGNGSVNEGETRAWLAFLAENQISWANWSLNNKDEACSAIAPWGSRSGPWSDDQLTTSGRLVKGAIP